MKNRTRVIMALVLFGFLGVALRLVVVQGVGRGSYAQLSLKEHQRILLVHGERGVVLDRNGDVLASNRSLPGLVCDPTVLKKHSSVSRVARELSGPLGISPAHLSLILNKKSRFVWIRHDLFPQTVSEIKELRIPGLYVMNEERRFYPGGEAFHTLIGTTGRDNSGLSGIERRFDRELSGHTGGRVIEVSARGRSYFFRDLVAPEKLSGNVIRLTVDGELQKYAQLALDEEVDKVQAEGGVVLVMDPKTGAILAMASNNKGMQAQINPAVSMVYEPGSIFKLVTASAALNEKAVTLGEQFDGHDGIFYIPGGVLHDDEPQKSLNLAGILAKSSNIGISQVGLRLGPSRFYRYIRLFGFGARTGIAYPGESSGILHPLSRWSHRSIYSISMGQEIGVTPIQLVTAVSAIANGGKLMQPYLVSSIASPAGETIWKGKPRMVREVISRKTSRTLLGLMENVVSPGGTGVNAAISGYDVAGKTGTAQVYDPLKRAYTRKRTIDSFVGVLPVQDPSLVILVIVAKPKSLSWGGTVAAPLFRKIAQMALVHFRIPSPPPSASPVESYPVRIIAEAKKIKEGD
ncbi:MAG: peptidoglycan D,D-transpeptidase FtsI family protein [Leptospirillum sp.]